MQSPLELSEEEFGYSSVHKPTFNYPEQITGNLGYSGWSLLFTYDVTDDNYTSLPSLTFSENGDLKAETVYNIGWVGFFVSKQKKER